MDELAEYPAEKTSLTDVISVAGVAVGGRWVQHTKSHDLATDETTSHETTPEGIARHASFASLTLDSEIYSAEPDMERSGDYEILFDHRLDNQLDVSHGWGYGAYCIRFRSFSGGASKTASVLLFRHGMWQCMKPSPQNIWSINRN